MKVLEMIRDWKQVTDLPAPQVELGSSLAGDGRKSPLHQVAHSAWAGFVQAADHLNACQGLMTQVGLHPFAPYALIRAAMDNAALAVWLLGPTSRDERLTRVLHLAYEDLRQEEGAHTWLTRLEPEPPPPPRRPFEVRKSEVMELAKSLGLDPRVVGGRFRYEKIIRSAGELTPNLGGDQVALAWRLCSGFAHGRQWAPLSFLTKEVLDRGAEFSDVRLTTRPDQVLVTAGVPVALGQRALQLYEQRRRSYYRAA